MLYMSPAGYSSAIRSLTDQFLVNAEHVLVLLFLGQSHNATKHGRVGHEGRADQVRLGQENHQMVPLQVPS